MSLHCIMAHCDCTSSLICGSSSVAQQYCAPLSMNNKCLTNEVISCMEVVIAAACMPVDTFVM